MLHVAPLVKICPAGRSPRGAFVYPAPLTRLTPTLSTCHPFELRFVRIHALPYPPPNFRSFLGVSGQIRRLTFSESLARYRASTTASRSFWFFRLGICRTLAINGTALPDAGCHHESMNSVAVMLSLLLVLPRQTGEEGCSLPLRPRWLLADDTRSSRYCLACWKQRFRKDASMLQSQIHSFPAGLKVDSTFDIFKRLPDGIFTRIAAVRGLREARRRINRLARVVRGHYWSTPKVSCSRVSLRELNHFPADGQCWPKGISSGRTLAARWEGSRRYRCRTRRDSELIASLRPRGLGWNNISRELSVGVGTLRIPQEASAGGSKKPCSDFPNRGSKISPRTPRAFLSLRH
jgi:hypothetical protein